MNYHRITNLNGTIITVIDTKKYSKERSKKRMGFSLRRIFNRLVTPNSAVSTMAVLALPAVASTIA